MCPLGSDNGEACDVYRPPRRQEQNERARLGRYDTPPLSEVAAAAASAAAEPPRPDALPSSSAAVVNAMWMAGVCIAAALGWAQDSRVPTLLAAAPGAAAFASDVRERVHTFAARAGRASADSLRWHLNAIFSACFAQPYTLALLDRDTGVPLAIVFCAGAVGPVAGENVYVVLRVREAVPGRALTGAPYTLHGLVTEAELRAAGCLGGAEVPPLPGRGALPPHAFNYCLDPDAVRLGAGDSVRMAGHCSARVLPVWREAVAEALVADPERRASRLPLPTAAGLGSVVLEQHRAAVSGASEAVPAWHDGEFGVLLPAGRAGVVGAPAVAALVLRRSAPHTFDVVDLVRLGAARRAARLVAPVEGTWLVPGRAAAQARPRSDQAGSWRSGGAAEYARGHARSRSEPVVPPRAPLQSRPRRFTAPPAVGRRHIQPRQREPLSAADGEDFRAARMAQGWRGGGNDGAAAAATDADDDDDDNNDNDSGNGTATRPVPPGSPPVYHSYLAKLERCEQHSSRASTYRTKPCKFYNGQPGSCRNGGACNFIHASADGGD